MIANRSGRSRSGRPSAYLAEEPRFTALPLRDFPVVVERLVSQSGICEDDVLAVAGVSTVLWRRRRGARRMSTRESDRLYRLIRVFEEACQLHEGDKVAARQWLTNPALGLGNERPVDFLSTSAEFQCVLDLISRLDAGVVV